MSNPVLQTLEIAIGKLVVPLNLDLPNMSSQDVASLWAKQNMDVRSVLNDAFQAIHRQAAQSAQQQQGPTYGSGGSQSFAQGGGVSAQQSQIDVVNLAKELYVAAQSANRNVMPAEAIDKAQNFIKFLLNPASVTPR